MVLVLPGHVTGLGQRNKGLCELFHIRAALFAAGSTIRPDGTAKQRRVKQGKVKQGNVMRQRLDRWQCEADERLWLALLIDAMEQVARPEIACCPSKARFSTPCARNWRGRFLPTVMCRQSSACVTDFLLLSARLVAHFPGTHLKITRRRF